MTADQSVTRAKARIPRRARQVDPYESVVDYDREEVRSIEKFGLYEEPDPIDPSDYL